MKALLVGAGFGFALTVSASPAMAQDASFTGFHVELVTGYDNVGVDFDDDVFGGGKNSQNGWLYGLGLGYDYQTEGWVFGVEGELTDSTASRKDSFSGTRPANGATPARPISVNNELNADADFYIGGRIGYEVAPQFLLYAKAGYTHAKIEIEGNGLDNGVAFTYDESVSLSGFRLGIGGEYKFTSNVFGKIEYRYSNYNNGDLDIRGANVNLNPVFHGIDVVRHQAAVAVGYRF